MTDDVRSALKVSMGDFTPMLANVRKRFPALGPHIDNTVAQWGDKPPVPGAQMETFPPWETDNPNPGKITLEYYNKKLAGPDLEDSAAADLLHIAGAKHPATGRRLSP